MMSATNPKWMFVMKAQSQRTLCRVVGYDRESVPLLTTKAMRSRKGHVKEDQ
jgi:hypothetical protein